jgi:hypothetical protein
LGRVDAVFDGAAFRGFGAALRDTARRGVLFAFARRADADVPEARRAFDRAAFLLEALRAGRDVRRRAAEDFRELWRDFAWAFRPVFREDAFALRFAITNVLSASPALPGRPEASLTVYS